MPLPSDETTPPVTTTILAMCLSPTPKGLVLAARLGARAPSLQRFELLRRVHARERARPRDHPDSHATLEGAELFEPFLLLHPPRRPRRELEQELASERV